MYPLLLCVALTSTLLFLRAYEKRSLGRWLAYSLATGVALYAHYFAALLPLIHLAYMIFFRPKLRLFFAWVAAASVSGLMFAPWVFVLWNERLGPEGIASVSNNIRLAPPEYSFFGLLYGMVAFFAVFFVGYQGVGALAYMSGVLGGMWPLAIIGGSARRRGDPGMVRVHRFLITWIVMAVGIAFVLNSVAPGLLVQKYLILASPPLFILAARALERLLGADPRGIAIVFALFAAIAIVQDAQPLNPLREDFRAASEIMVERGVPGEQVFVFPRYNSTPLGYYRDPDTIEALVSPAQPPAAAVARLTDFASKHRGATFWTVALYSENADPNGIVDRFLSRSFDRLATYNIGARMRVSRYGVPAHT